MKRRCSIFLTIAMLLLFSCDNEDNLSSVEQIIQQLESLISQELAPYSDESIYAITISNSIDSGIEVYIGSQNEPPHTYLGEFISFKNGVSYNLNKLIKTHIYTYGSSEYGNIPALNLMMEF